MGINSIAECLWWAADKLIINELGLIIEGLSGKRG